jgi:uncharacterized protein VirK/YbjX
VAPNNFTAILLHNTPWRRKLWFGFRGLRHLPAILPLLVAKRKSSLATLIRLRPQIIAFSLYRYLAANWSVETRVARIVQHCRIVDEVGGVLRFRCDDVVDLVVCDAIDPKYRISLDQTPWLLSEGLLVISLWEDIDRLYALSFNLACDGGVRVAYIGCLQGRAEDDVLDRYRLFTKAAFGMRPRDFLIEIFKAFCRSLAVSRIYAVADNNQSGRSAYVRNGAATGDDLSLGYDQVWLERGGIDKKNGFFELPLEAGRRQANEIAPKKRAMYRRRYAMMDEIEIRLSELICGSAKDEQRLPKIYYG